MKWKITVLQVVKDLSDPDDRELNPEGIYILDHEDLRTEYDALDRFSETMAIGCVDDFDIECVPASDEDLQVEGRYTYNARIGLWQRIIRRGLPVERALRLTNWAELARQKLALLEVMRQLDYAPDRKVDTLEALEGLLSFLDAIQDAAEAEGYPVVFLTEGEEQPSETTHIECPYCHEQWSDEDIVSGENTWQQWRCRACGNWVDKPHD